MRRPPPRLLPLLGLLAIAALCVLNAPAAPADAPPADAVAPAAPIAELPATPDDDGTATEAVPDDLDIPGLIPEPQSRIGCDPPGCNNTLDCRNQGYYCPLGEIHTCFGSTGNCDGVCGCS